MGAQDEERLLRFNETLGQECPTLWTIRTGSNADGPFREFLDLLKEKVPAVRIKIDDGLAPKIPEIRVRRNLVWHAVPDGPELSPFLEALAGTMNDALSLSPEAAARLEALDAPAELTLFIAPGCPYCPTAVRRLLPLITASEMVHLKIIDGSMFSEAAALAQIRSVPTVILDGVYRWTGQPPIEEMVHVISKRDPEALGSVALENLIADGKAGRIAAMMLARGKIFPAFIEVMTHERWPVRLGAMVAVEYLLDEDPVLAAHLEKPLWERFDGVADAVKGDIVQVLGDIGGEQTLARLQKILRTSPSADIREAAAEGAEKIRLRVSHRHAPDHEAD